MNPDVILQIFEERDDLDPHLAAHFGRGVRERVAEFALSVRQAIQVVLLRGTGAVMEQTDRLMTTLSALQDEFKQDREAIELQCLAYLHRKYDEVISVALGTVRREIHTTESHLSLKEVRCSFKVSLSSSLKAALTELLSIVATGQIEVSAVYNAGLKENRE